MLTNTSLRYGIIAIVLHWLIAIAVVGEFGLGIYMTGLDYYHPNYHTYPFIHESVGVLLLVLVVFRFGWSIANVTPTPGAGVGPWAHRLSFVVQQLMTILVVAISVFGYLVTTAEGEALAVFNWFSLPALTVAEGQEDISIFLHYWLAWTVMGLALLHTLGALKHHFLDRDETLRRMLGLGDRRGF